VGRLEGELARLKEQVEVELAVSAHGRGGADLGERTSYWQDLFGRWREGGDLSGANAEDVALLNEYGPVFARMVEEGIFDADDGRAR
jgi:hypothetical protein